ncbi:hypothetical protein [uncultured Tateyamaria sp.]|nr:hypothetical protein [uncultured Tateyamaria sp.]
MNRKTTASLSTDERVASNVRNWAISMDKNAFRILAILIVLGTVTALVG